MTKYEWIFREIEKAFEGLRRSYRVKGRPKIDVETFKFNKAPLIELTERELKTRNSAKIQTISWIRFAKDEGPECAKRLASGGPGVAKRPLYTID